MDSVKATVKEVIAFFADSEGLHKPTMQELKALKDAGGYDAIAEGVGNGSLTY